jgi:hypothetical protein
MPTLYLTGKYRTGTFGTIFQAVTITIVAPVYLIMQLLQSSSNAPEETLLVHPSDLDLLPLSAILTYIVPTIGLCLPILNLLSDKAKLFVVAFWQPFPLYHTIVRGVSQALRRRKHLDTKERSRIHLQHCRQALQRSNWIMAFLVFMVHMIVMITIAVSNIAQLVPQVSGHHILALTSLERPPAMVMLHPPVALTESREDCCIIPSLGRLLHLYCNALMGILSSIQGSKLSICFDSYNQGFVVRSSGWSNFPSADVYLGARRDSFGHGRISAKRSHCSKEYRGTRRHGRNYKS